MTNSNMKTLVYLPREYEPSQKDILCGRGKVYSKHPANKVFARHISDRLEQYKTSSKRIDKSIIVRTIVDEVREKGYRFIKNDPARKQWYEITDDAAHQKTSHALRDTMKSMGNFRPKLVSSSIISPFIPETKGNLPVLLSSSHTAIFTNIEPTLSSKIQMEEAAVVSSLSQSTQETDYHVSCGRSNEALWTKFNGRDTKELDRTQSKPNFYLLGREALMEDHHPSTVNFISSKNSSFSSITMDIPKEVATRSLNHDDKEKGHTWQPENQSWNSSRSFVPTAITMLSCEGMQNKNSLLLDDVYPKDRNDELVPLHPSSITTCQYDHIDSRDMHLVLESLRDDEEGP